MKRYKVIFELTTGEMIEMFVNADDPIDVVNNINKIYKDKKLFRIDRVIEIGTLKKKGEYHARND